LKARGKFLVWSSTDFEDFMAPRPELSPQMERDLAGATRLIAGKQWPIRQHATYDQSISRILDVFEPIFKETGYRARWGIDHAETITPRNIARIKAMDGGIAIQDRIAFAGEFFMERYGRDAASHAPPRPANAGRRAHCRRRNGRDPRRELQSLDLPLLDGDRQNRGWDAARIAREPALARRSIAALHHRQRLV
jgi:hypothetical protein